MLVDVNLCLIVRKSKGEKSENGVKEVREMESERDERQLKRRETEKSDGTVRDQ